MAVQLTHEDFVVKARKVHGEKFEYNSPFTKTANYIEITCPKHGPFTQNAGRHLSGGGCAACYNERRWTKNARP